MISNSTDMYRCGDTVEFARLRVNQIVARGTWHATAPRVASTTGVPTMGGFSTKCPARPLGAST